MVVVLLMAGDQEPVMPLFEVVGSINEPPEHIGATCVKVGVTLALTVTEIVLALAHWPASDVKVSVWLPGPATEGLKELPPATPGPDQFPVMPLWVVFRAVGAAKTQKGPIGVRVGVILVLTVTVMVCEVAQGWSIALGVKV